MDFITGFPRILRKLNSIMVVVYRLNKVANLIVVKSTNSTSEVAQIFIKEIVRMHGVPKKIILNIYAKFTSKFKKELIIGLGTKLAFSTTYHPQTNG